MNARQKHLLEKDLSGVLTDKEEREELNPTKGKWTTKTDLESIVIKLNRAASIKNPDGTYFYI